MSLFVSQCVVDGMAVGLGTWPTREQAQAAQGRFKEAALALAKKPCRIPRLCSLAREIVAESFHARGKVMNPTGREYRGLRRERQSRWWSATYFKTHPNGRREGIALGCYVRQEDAARAYDRFLLFLGTTNLFLLNFPGEHLEPASAPVLREEAAKLAKQEMTSQYRGVSYVEKTGNIASMWIVQLNDNSTCGEFPVGIPNHICNAGTEELAAECHDRAALWYFKEKAILNFPEKRTVLVPTPPELLRAEYRLIFKARTKSRFRGVAEIGEGRWYATTPACKEERRSFRGNDEEDAARIYDELSLARHGRKAYFNFHPMTGEEICGRRLTDEEWAEFEARRASNRAFQKAC